MKPQSLNQRIIEMFYILQTLISRFPICSNIQHLQKPLRGVYHKLLCTKIRRNAALHDNNVFLGAFYEPKNSLVRI